MGSIPLPALAVKPPDQPDPLGAFQKLMALRSLANQQQIQQQTIQTQQQEQQLRAQQIADQQLTQQYLAQNKDATFADAAEALKGKISVPAYTNLMDTDATIKQKHSQATQADLDNQQKVHSEQQRLYNNAANLSDEDLAKQWPTIASQFNSIPGNQVKVDPNQPMTKAQLQQHGVALALQENYLKQELDKRKEAAEAGEKEADTRQKNLVSDFYSKNPGAGAPGVGPETVSMVEWLRQNPDKTAADYPAAKAASVAKAEEPSKIRVAKAEAKARLDAAQGDPNVAGQMLSDGTLTLADLKTRGTTPDFIEKATTAARKLNPSYNAADEVIAESVAKSPAANQFFGSANSLIEKGGTLDQLEELGKKIPQHDFPALNTVDDWQKLARGKGALAGYAAKVLGVADDYAKVMGGGQGSDTSREQALQLFSKAASPEQRAQAVAATRGAVLSQRDARIGKNQFLKRQYGSGELGGQPAPDPFAGGAFDWSKMPEHQ